MHTSWIDGHLDLACISVEGRDILRSCEDPLKGCISIPDLLKSPVRVVFGTIFTAPNYDSPITTKSEYSNANQAFEAGKLQLDTYRMLEAQGLAQLQHGELTLTQHDEPLGIYLLMEGADPIRGSEDVAWWRSQGLRLVGLTWSRGTRYAGGNAQSSGLTSEGRELIAALDESDIAHDVSHCSDASLEGVLECAQGTIVATHASSRNILGGDNQRHLRDDHAREILRRGGVIGLNLYGEFLANDRRPTIQDCVDHVLHFCTLAGNRDQVALGSDYDGGFTPEELPIGLEHPNRLHALLEALADAGFSEHELRGFAHENWLRCLGKLPRS